MWEKTMVKLVEQDGLLVGAHPLPAGYDAVLPGDEIGWAVVLAG